MLKPTKLFQAGYWLLAILVLLFAPQSLFLLYVALGIALGFFRSRPSMPTPSKLAVSAPLVAFGLIALLAAGNSAVQVWFGASKFDIFVALFIECGLAWFISAALASGEMHTNHGTISRLESPVVFALVVSIAVAVFFGMMAAPYLLARSVEVRGR